MAYLKQIFNIFENQAIITAVIKNYLVANIVRFQTFELKYILKSVFEHHIELKCLIDRDLGKENKKFQ